MEKLEPLSPTETKQYEHDKIFDLDKELQLHPSAPAPAGVSHLHLDVDNIEDPFCPSPNSLPLGCLGLISTNESHHPIHWPTWKKWLIVTVYCLVQMVVLELSTSYVSAQTTLQEQFGGSKQTITLGQSLFIVGNGIGPVFFGPLSDIVGRKWVYVGSIAMFGLSQIGCALATGLPMLVIFMLFSGIFGSTALSNVAATITDLFGDGDNTSQPLGLFVLSSNSGSSLGSVVGEWLVENPHLNSNWVFWINAILAAVFVFIMMFIPETLPRIVISRAVPVSGKDEKEEVFAHSRSAAIKEMRFVLTMAVKILFTEPIVTCLGIFNGYIYGLLFLYLYGISDVFVVNNHLSKFGANLTYLNIIVGVVIMFFVFVPIQTALYKRDRLKHGTARPESRFLLSLVCVWGFPISLFWFAFTSNGNVSYWCPLVAGTVMGISNPLLYFVIMNYITDSYKNAVGGAVAALLIPTQLVAAACIHIGVAMFDNLTTTWAFIILALVSLGVVASVYVFYFWGSALRRRSKLAMDPGL